MRDTTGKEREKAPDSRGKDGEGARLWSEKLTGGKMPGVWHVKAFLLYHKFLYPFQERVPLLDTDKF